jgi:hypothetical protein
MRSRWPEHLGIARHGESAGNGARDLAHANKASRIDISAPSPEHAGLSRTQAVD